MTAPPSVTAPEHAVFVAVSVDDVKPNDERQPDDWPACPAAVTVNPTGKVTVSVPDSAAASVKESENATPVAPALRRLRIRPEERVEPEMEKTSSSDPVAATVSVATAVTVCVA